MKNFTKFTFGALFVFGALAIASCGGNNDAPTSGDNTSGSPATSTPAGSTSADHTHSYAFSSFEWTETPGAYTAKAVYTCSAGDSTVKYDATVTKTAHVDATCSATGSNTWKASYDGHEDTKIETVAKLPHTPNAYGFCSVCGEYAGNTATGLTYEVSKTADQLDYFRIAVEPGREYSWALDVQYVSNAFFRSTTGDLLPFYGDDPALVPANSDGYIYFVLTFASAGTFHATLTLLPLCDHASLNIYGFCNSCGRYRGETILPYSSPVSLAGLTGKRFFRYYLYDYDGCNTVIMSNAKDESDNQVELNAYYQDLDGVMHPLDEHAYGEIFVEKGQYILKRESGNARYLYLAVNYTGSGTVSGTLALGDLNEYSYGYDRVAGYGLFHGDYTPVGFDHNFESAHIFENTTSGVFTYALNVTGLTSGKCYKVTPNSIEIELDHVYEIDGNTICPMMSGNGYFEFAPHEATTTATLVFKSNSAITTSDSVLIEEGHFANPEDNYKGFYCNHHMMPVWTGSNEDITTYTTIEFDEGETKYYRFQAAVGHDLSLYCDSYSGFEAKLYYWTGYQMTEISPVEPFTYKNLPLGINVDGETDSYYFLSLRNTDPDHGLTRSVSATEEHNYNAAGFCEVDGDYHPSGYTLTQNEVDNHTELNFNVVINGTKPVRFPVVAGHEFKVKFRDSNSFLVTNDNQVRFFFKDDSGEAQSINIARTDSNSFYLNAPVGSDDGYIYMIVNPTAGAVNSAGLQIYDGGHNPVHGLCLCGDYNGETLEYDVEVSGHSDLLPGEECYLRFEIVPGYTKYDVSYDTQFEDDDLNFYYFDSYGEAHLLEKDPYDKSMRIVTTSITDSLDNYVYLVISNSTSNPYEIDHTILDYRGA